MFVPFCKSFGLLKSLGLVFCLEWIIKLSKASGPGAKGTVDL